MSREQDVRDALAEPFVQKMLDEVLRKEGGYNDIKEDRGGATNFGISLRYARGLGLRLDNDGDGDVDADDILLVTEQQARVLYVEDFYVGPRYHRLPYALRPFMVDFAINSGAARASIELQDVLNARGSQPPLVADGVIGPATLRAVDRVLQRTGQSALLHALVQNRVDYVLSIIARDPSQAKFRKGWITRIESFRPKL